jgi:hypothetical protein
VNEFSLFLRKFAKNEPKQGSKMTIRVEGKNKTRKEQNVEAKKQTKTLNLRWGELDQDDKEVILKVVKETPSWTRILLYGETRLGSEEEMEALLRHNDGLFNALFVQTSDATVKMKRYNNAVVRLFVPSSQLRSAWEGEEEYLGLRSLDDSADFIYAVYDRLMAQTKGRSCYPFQRFGRPSPAWGEDSVNTMYLGGWMLFKKAFLLDITLTRFFAKLPRHWFADIALRELDAKESALASAVARVGRSSLTNGEIGALKSFEEGNRVFMELQEGDRENNSGAWRNIL